MNNFMHITCKCTRYTGQCRTGYAHLCLIKLILYNIILFRIGKKNDDFKNGRKI